MSMHAIRDYYGVPAKRGAEVRFLGRRAWILSADRTSMHLWIELQTGPGGRIKVHPTWEMDYLDGQGVRG